MATQEVRVCDVYGMVKGAERVTVTIERGGEDTTWEKDLSPRAFDRLVKFVDRGTTPPAGKKNGPA